MTGRLTVFALSAALVTATATAASGGMLTKPSKRDQAILRAGVINDHDVPPGTARHLGDMTSVGARGITACAAFRAASGFAKRSATSARSAQYVQSDPNSGATATAQDAVYAFKSPEAASRYLAAFHADDTASCLQASVQRALSVSGSGLFATAAVPIEGLTSVGDDAAGFEFPATDQPQTTTLYTDVAVVRVGRAVLSFEFSQFDQPSAQAPELINAVVDRVAPTTR